MTRPHGEGGIPAVHDERVEHALERLRKNFYHLWKKVGVCIEELVS